MDPITTPVSHHHKISHHHSTCDALGRAAKCFGRWVCKLTVAIPYVAYHTFSTSTELLFGAGGAVVGAVRGGTVILAKEAGSRLGLCQKSTKPLSEYIIKDFHRGANVGWLPGQIMGVAGSVITAAALLDPVGLVLAGASIGAFSLVEGVFAYKGIKSTGYSCLEQDSKNALRDIRRECRELHDWLYGDKKF
ncbi:hypothetical protein [Endozoicomonas sp. SCSIO W0465]|uniref:hypothetical protein n=1 Tax=Endozoicomonas sp. SCSIO W0465 TaxID=2918516 RepID=UPI002075C6C0|nr:hypothetical protein [Endozoicomonas sp. SCSIO W0465]USE37139.1 hypothetical protein MJO57_02595 [Endozoicomonas sp. SCSIO W0465]